MGAERVARARLDAVEVRAQIEALVADELQQVEETFRANLASPIRIVAELGSFVADGGGKRIRPTLHLLFTHLCGYTGPHGPLLGSVVEFIHCATLIHDDIIDDAKTRRGRPSLNSRWGSSITVLFGDYMFAKAMELALRAESLPVMRKLAEVTLRMTEGEMLQTRYLGRLDLSVEEYLDLVEKKTAALFGCCGDLAGLLAGLDPQRQAALHRYGMHLGLAFQVIDDLLDLTGDAEILGKPAASDLREGKLTLAVLDLLASGSGEARQVVQQVMNGVADVERAIARLTVLLEQSGALERSRQIARGHARRAIAELEPFRDSAARRALRALPDLLIDRDH